MIQVMMNVMAMLQREEGQDLAEYALILVLIAIAVIGAVTALGGQITTVFNQISAGLNP